MTRPLSVAKLALNITEGLMLHLIPIPDDGDDDRVRHGTGLRHAGAFDAGDPRESLPAVVVGTAPDGHRSVISDSVALLPLAASGNCTDPPSATVTDRYGAADFTVNSGASRSIETICCTVQMKKNLPHGEQSSAAVVAHGDAADGEDQSAAGIGAGGSVPAASGAGIYRGGDAGRGIAAPAQREAVGETCPACLGTGRGHWRACSYCAGSGVTPAVPRSPAVRPQSLARERYESAWAIKQSLRSLALWGMTNAALAVVS